MAGLLIKDFRLNMKRKTTLLIFAVICIIMAISQGGSFVIPYMTFLCSIFAIGTISYDDMDNCMAFLLTLPVSRKEYVREKYLYCMGFGAVGWLFSLAVAVLVEFFQNGAAAIPELIETALITIPLYVVILSILIPVQIRFGVENSRVVMMVIGGLAAVPAFTFYMVLPENTMVRLGGFLSRLGTTTVISGIFVLSVVVLILSCRICSGIVEKKDY